jgi:MFS family permease
MGTTEFVIAGLLPEIADDLDVSVSQAGLLITAFAAGMIVGAPMMAIARLRLPRRSTPVSRSSSSPSAIRSPRSVRPSRSCSRPAW